MRRLLGIALLVGLTAYQLQPADALAEELTRRTVAVSAMGAVATRPDIAHISTGVVSEGETAHAALEQNTRAMTNVVAALKAQGIAPKDIQTTDFSVHPRYQHSKDGAPATVVGYRVVNSVRITVREIPKLGAILDQVVSFGSNEIGGIAFDVEDQAALLDEARRRAMGAAQSKARLLAEAAGAMVGKVLTISEEQQNPPPRPMYARTAIEAKAAEVPIEAGEHTVQVRVNVTWELQ